MIKFLPSKSIKLNHFQVIYINLVDIKLKTKREKKTISRVFIDLIIIISSYFFMKKLIDSNKYTELHSLLLQIHFKKLCLENCIKF